MGMSDHIPGMVPPIIHRDSSLIALLIFFFFFSLPCSVPDENIATPHRDAVTIEGQGGDVLLNGDTENYTGENGYTTHSITRDHSKGITVLLGQPYIINCIRMLLWDKDNRLDRGIQCSSC